MATFIFSGDLAFCWPATMAEEDGERKKESAKREVMSVPCPPVPPVPPVLLYVLRNG